MYLSDCLSYLVVVGDDWGNLPAGQSDILPWQVVNSPSAGVQGMIEGIFSAVAPVPALQCGRTLYREHLLVNCLPPTTQTHCELKKGRGSKRT